MTGRPSDRFTCETCGRTVYSNAEGHTHRPRPGLGVCKHGYVRPCPICPDPPAYPGLDADLATRLREERDKWEMAFVDADDRLEAAEAECARLRQALALLGGIDPDRIGDWEMSARPEDRERQMRAFSREALAGPGSEQSSLTESGSAGLPDTPACEHDWIWPANVVCAKCGISGGDTPADSQEDKT